MNLMTQEQLTAKHNLTAKEFEKIIEESGMQVRIFEGDKLYNSRAFLRWINELKIKEDESSK